MRMTKAQVTADFRKYYMPAIRAEYEQDGKPDYVARAEAWNNYTDMLCKEGRISTHQYNTWTCPFDRR